MNRAGGATRGLPTREASGPPRLQLPLWRNLGLMALVNALPLCALGWFFIGYDQGVGFHLRHHQPGISTAMIAVIGSCAMIALGAWVLMPLARWVHTYPRWHYRHSRFWYLWIPLVLAGDATSLAILLLALAVVLASLAVVVLAVMSLHH